MREPAFWYGPPSLLSHVLAPVAALYGAIAARRMARPGARCGVPVICVGNYHLGGAGKTPTVLALAALLHTQGERPIVVSRGYGGRLSGPVRVDAARHAAQDVGDEPLMMAQRVPVIVARDRASGAALAVADGASVILLDDGFQNPALAKSLSLIVIDTTRGIGNGLVFPAGPLRAPLAMQLARTDALIVIGDGHGAEAVAATLSAQQRPVLRARLMPDAAAAAALHDRPVLAFAGIGDPLRFFATLRGCGARVIETRAFADHHRYTPEDIAQLARMATERALALVTTEKDMARIRSDAQLAPYAGAIATLPVTLAFDEDAALRALIARAYRTS